MALDTTVVPFTKAPASQYLMNRGVNARLGTAILQAALRSNADVSSKGKLYWRTFGVATNRPKINDVLEVYQGITGGVAKTLATVEIGRKADIQLMYTHPTLLGKQLSSKSAIAVVYPAVPIASDIDDTAGTVSTIFSIPLTAVTGFAVGQTIEVVTGVDAIKEYSVIKSIDVTGKIVYLETPLSQLPPDTAAVNVVASFKETNSVLSSLPDYLFRIVEYVHSNESLEIQYFGNAQIKQISVADGKDGKTASEYAFTLELQPTPVMDSQTNVVSDVLYTRETILKV